MFEQSMCWVNGDIVPASDAKISIFDHGFLYGDGVFEGIRFYKKNIFRLPLHLKRLQRSAYALQLDIPLNCEELTIAVNKTVIASPLENGYLRLIVTRGVGALGINPATCENPSVLILVDQLHVVSEQQRKNGIRAIIASTRRPTPDRLDPRIKSLNYMNSILARMEANYAGVEEAILLNDRGNVAEGTADNLFIVQDGQLLTPLVTEGALAGITRDSILELAVQLGIPAKQTVLTSYDLYTADECFLTGTGAKLIPVREIDGRKIQSCPGNIYLQLSVAFTELVARETA